MNQGNLALCVAGLWIQGEQAHAQRLEIAGYVGPSFPTYQQSLTYHPGPISIPGGGSIPAQSALRLDARGATAVSGAVTLYLAGFIGLEGRLDTTDVDLRTTGAVYRAQLDFPEPLPDALAAVELGAGVLDVERVTAYSANLKLRTSGRLRFTLSGGLSYLPQLRILGAQAVRLSLADLQGRPLPFSLSTVGLRAEALPNETERGRIGANAGAGLQIKINDNVSLVGEGRYFLFQEHTLRWRRDRSAPLSAIEDTLLDEIETNLDPVDFHPTFFQVAGGIAISF